MRLLMALVFMAGMAAAQAHTYPPLSEYMMPREAEIALAKSGAPASISDHATIKVLTESGYQVARQGDNGFVCIVLRGWTAPTYGPAVLRDLVYDAHLRGPICLNPPAVKTVLPYYDLRTKLGMEQKSPDEITAAIESAYSQGQIPPWDPASMGFMWSADQAIGPGGEHWHPHMMLFIPYANDATVGGSPIGPLPAIGEGAGTPFSVILIPVDDKLAVKAQQN